MQLNYILISDGTSDKALLPIIDYTLQKYHATVSFRGERADFSRLPKNPKNLTEKITVAIDLFDPLLLFIHRDTENEKATVRESEIDTAIRSAVKKNIDNKKYVKIIPIRMTEAWLLMDEVAIRKASGNPNGTVKLSLPKINTLETLPDPKMILEKLIKDSSQLSSRRLKSLNVRFAIQLVSQYIEDFSPLKNLNSYKHFEKQIKDLTFTIL